MPDFLGLDGTAVLALSGLVLLLAVLLALLSRYRTRSQKNAARALAAALDKETARHAALARIATRALECGSLERVCRDIADVTTGTMGCEYALILESGTGTNTCTVAAASGPNDASFEGVTFDAGPDTQIGYALQAREPVAIRDVNSDTRFTIPDWLRTRGVRSGLAMRIGTSVRTFGVVAVYSAAPRQFTATDDACLSAAAAAIAGLFERRRLDAEQTDLAARDKAHRTESELASRRTTFLAQARTVLESALNPDATLISLARLAVPALADCAIVDFVEDDGRVRRIDVIDIDPTRRAAVQAIRRAAPNLSENAPFARAIRTGQPVLLSGAIIGDPDRSPTAADEQLTRAIQCDSMLLIPLIARGQTIGLLALATRSANRYGTAELMLARELAGHAAIALDNARLYREAEAASRAKDEFLATISHELRTPINAVLGWTAMLREQQLDPAQAEYACEAIDRSARAQAQLVEQLLDVSRIVSGKLELQLAPIHLDAIVEAALDTVRPSAEDKKIRIGGRLDRNLPLLMGDPERLQQVVTNLLSNAVKFSREGGHVQVELRRADGSAQIVVGDEGIGIKSEFLPYVFDRLKQGGSNRFNTGLGLGLWIVRDIVERHGGTVNALSPGEGKGATFIVNLPIHVAAEVGHRTS